MNDIITVYTDGSCLNNGAENAKCGWAYKLIYKGNAVTGSGGVVGGTNNQMEIMAVTMALRRISNPELPVVIYSDSQYVVNTINHNWKTEKNVEFWAELKQEISRFQNISLRWVKGHNGNPNNEEVDRLAVAAAKNCIE